MSLFQVITAPIKDENVIPYSKNAKDHLWFDYLPETKQGKNRCAKIWFSIQQSRSFQKKNFNIKKYWSLISRFRDTSLTILIKVILRIHENLYYKKYLTYPATEWSSSGNEIGKESMCKISQKIWFNNREEKFQY